MVEPTGYCQLPSGSGLPHSLNFMLSGPPPPRFKKDLFYLVCMCVFVFTYVRLPRVVRRGCWLSYSWGYRWL